MTRQDKTRKKEILSLIESLKLDLKIIRDAGKRIGNKSSRGFCNALSSAMLDDSEFASCNGVHRLLDRYFLMYRPSNIESNLDYWFPAGHVLRRLKIIRAVVEKIKNEIKRLRAELRKIERR